MPCGKMRSLLHNGGEALKVFEQGYDKITAYQFTPFTQKAYL